MFETVGRLYGVTVEQVEGVRGWHPDVKYYQIREGGTLLTLFLGRTGGCLGETSALLLLLGGVYLVARRERRGCARQPFAVRH